MSYLSKAASNYFTYFINRKYGICKTDAFTEPLYLYFKSLCDGEECDCCDDDSDTSVTVDCGVSVSDTTNSNPCSISVVDTGQYAEYTLSGLEIGSYLLQNLEVLDNELEIIISEFYVNGTNYIPVDLSLRLTPENLVSQTYNSLDHVVNLVTFLNGLHIPNFYFTIDTGVKNGETLQVMRVRHPKNDTWSLKTKANDNGDEHIFGVSLNNTGLLGVQVNSGGSYLTPVYDWYVGIERYKEFNI